MDQITPIGLGPRTWVPLLFFLGLMAIIHVASELVGTDGITALIYILSGAAK